MILNRDNNLLAANQINNALPAAPQMEIASTAFLNQLGLGNLPQIPPVEKHPYDNPNNRKNYTKYIIGTFPPISYLCDHPNAINGIAFPNGVNIDSPNIPFYHGNDESLWKVVFNAHGNLAAYQAINNRQAKVNFIQQWLNENGINIADIVQYTTRKRYTTSDSDLKNIIPNNQLIIELLNSNNELALLFNTSPVFHTIGLKILQNGNLSSSQNTAFGLFLLALISKRFKISFDWIQPVPMGWVQLNAQNINVLNYHLQNKCIIKIKIEISEQSDTTELNFDNFSKEITCIFGPSPSGRAALQLPINLIYQNSVILNGPMNHPQFCSFMMSKFLNYDANGRAQLIALNQ